MSPGFACLFWPNASGSSVWSVVRDRLIIGVIVEGEIRVRVEDDPIRIREVVGPCCNSGESVPDGNVEAFTDAGDPPERVMSLNVATQRIGKPRYPR